MQVSQVKIFNFLGITSYEFKAGRFNAFVGPNGTGKTSSLEAIKAVLKGGHDATLLHKGAEKGQVGLVLDNGQTVRARVTETKTDRHLLDERGKIIGGVTEIKALVDALSVNPVEFITASPERQASIIIEAMPLTADPERIKQITGQTVNCSAHALDVIAAVRKGVYDSRTMTNGAIKQAEAGLERAISTAPVVGTCDLDEDELNAKKDAVIAKREADLESLNKRILGVKDKAQADIDQIDGQIKVLQSDVGEKIKSLEQQIRDLNQGLNDGLRELEAKKSERRNFIAEQEGKAASAIQAKKSESDAQLGAINADLNAIKANRENAIRAKQAKEEIERATKEISDLKSTAEQQTKTLDDLDAYKLELLSALPIPGLEVKEGLVYYNGVPFARVNTAQQVRIAVKIAVMRAGPMPIVCVDGLECLDEATFEIFKEEMIASGCQCFTTRVGGEEFRLEVTE